MWSCWAVQRITLQAQWPLFYVSPVRSIKRVLLKSESYESQCNWGLTLILTTGIRFVSCVNEFYDWNFAIARVESIRPRMIDTDKLLSIPEVVQKIWIHRLTIEASHSRRWKQSHHHFMRSWIIHLCSSSIQFTKQHSCVCTEKIDFLRCLCPDLDITKLPQNDRLTYDRVAQHMRGLLVMTEKIQALKGSALYHITMNND